MWAEDTMRDSEASTFSLRDRQRRKDSLLFPRPLHRRMHRILLSFERLESFLPFAFQLLGVYGPMAWSVGRSPVGFPSHVLAFSR